MKWSKEPPKIPGFYPFKKHDWHIMEMVEVVKLDYDNGKGPQLRVYDSDAKKPEYAGAEGTGWLVHPSEMKGWWFHGPIPQPEEEL